MLNVNVAIGIFALIFRKWMMIKLNEHELSIACKIKKLKDAAGSHSPSIFTLAQQVPELKISVDACFLSNPYATALFLRYVEEELIGGGRLRDLLEFYPSQNRIIAQSMSDFIGVGARNIFIANGAIEVIQAVMHRFVRGRVVVCIPTFSSYYEFATTEVLFYPLKKEENFALDVEDYLRYVRAQRPQTVVLINPNNPDGGYLCTARLEYLLSALSFVENIILDISFMHFAYEDENLSLIKAEEFFKKFPNCILIKSMSKDFGVAGIRVGYAIMSEDRVDALLKNGYLWNSNGLAEYFLRTYAQEKFFKEYEQTRKKYIQQTQIFFAKLREIEGLKIYPSLANFALVELLDGSRAEDFVAKMLIKYGIYTRTCKDKIGLEGEFVRLASRTQEENEKILHALREIFKER